MSRGSAQRIVVVAAAAIASAAVWLVAGGRSAAARMPGVGLAARAPGHVLQTFADCPSARICFATARVASRGGGWVVHSDDPAGGARTWRATRVDGVESIACPTAHACVAVGRGVIQVSSDPTGPAGAWHRVSEPALARVTPLIGATPIACPSVHLCVAITDAPGGLLVSTDPMSPHGLWRPFTVRSIHDDLVEFTAVACASRRLCVAVDSDGDVVSSTDPANRLSWPAPRLVDARNGLLNVDCPSDHLCVAADPNGGVITSTRPAAGRGGWSRAQLGSANAYTSISAISCPSTRSCFASDYGGFTYHTSDPAAGGRAWSRGHYSDVSVTDLSCPSNRLCVAGGFGASLMSSTSPMSSWRTIALRGL